MNHLKPKDIMREGKDPVLATIKRTDDGDTSLPFGAYVLTVPVSEQHISKAREATALMFKALAVGQGREIDDAEIEEMIDAAAANAPSELPVEGFLMGWN